jgi:ATP-dependent DNA ligase
MGRAYHPGVAVVECLPVFVEPMLLTATREVPSKPGWALEVKWDGMRAQLRFDGRRVTVRSRTGREHLAEVVGDRVPADEQP